MKSESSLKRVFQQSPRGVNPVLSIQDAIKISAKIVDTSSLKEIAITDVHLLGGKGEGEGAWNIIYRGKGKIFHLVVIHFPEDECFIYDESGKLRGAYNRDGKFNPKLFKRNGPPAPPKEDPFK